MQLDLLKFSNMVTNTTSELLQALGQMKFFGKGEVMALEDAETDCTHQVCSRLMLPASSTLVIEHKLMSVIISTILIQM